MRESMIISYEDESKRYITCANSDCEVQDGDVVVPTFYSYDHAFKRGWVPSKDIEYCPPGQEHAWYCPNCVGKIRGEKNG